MRFVKTLCMAVAMLACVAAPSFAMDVVGAVKELALMPVHVTCAAVKAGASAASDCMAIVKADLASTPVVAPAAVTTPTADPVVAPASN